MHIIQMLTQQDTWTTQRTLLGLMYSRSTCKAPTRTKEQVGISIGESTEGVKGIANHRYRDTRREGRFFIENMLVGVVERGHDDTLSELII
jgi:hypothetical protein